MTYLAVAADHRKPFAGNSDRRKVGHRIKQHVVDACGELVDGIVVDGQGIDHADSLGCEVWYGTRDVKLPDRRPIIPTEVGNAGVKSVKIGFHADTDQWQAAVTAAELVVARVNSLGIQRFVLEPYFEQNLPPSLVRFVVKRLSRVPGVEFLKLDIGDDERLRLYAQACEIHWLVRSSGLNFSLFVDAVRRAARFGCAGTMVGRAVWGDLPWVSQPLAARAGLEQRLGLLRSVLGIGH